MNVLWTKGKSRKIFSTENANLHASGDGAAVGRCCRLCGGDTSLRVLGDTYVWEGLEERYDQLLYDCFGVTVSSSDSLICEWCVRQLRNTVRFKALVHAAFDKPPSSSIPFSSATPQIQEEVQISTPENENFGIIDNKVIIELLKTKMSTDKKKCRRTEKKPPEVKRTNVQCKVCKQKYVMILSSEALKDFVCSRCKKDNDKLSMCRKCNMSVPAGMMKEHMGLHSKANFRGKCRQPSLPKKPSQTKRQENLPRSRIDKSKCTVCPNKLTISENLVDHMKLVHDDRRNTTCVHCKKIFRTKEKLDQHTQMHLDQKKFINYYSLCGPSKIKHTSKVY